MSKLVARNWHIILAVVYLGCVNETVRADDGPNSPRPVPLTRPEMKQYLEDMKSRHPRIPLPPLSAEESARTGDRSTGYENRLRSLYLSDGDARRQAKGTEITAAAAIPHDLDYKFKTELFLDRVANNFYCMGHQESKLLGAGMVEDEIAALDGNWAEFTPAERAAFAFARKFTFQPHLLSDADITGLGKYYTPAQILEMILSMAGNNAINRWKEGIGVPQSANGGGFGGRGGSREQGAAAQAHTYLTTTSPAVSARITSVAPLVLDPVTGSPTHQTVCARPKLESRAEVEKALASSETRTLRLPLVDEEKVKENVKDESISAKPNQWVRLLATFPGQGKARIATQRNAEQKGDLSALLKAQVSWIIARQDRSWYALKESKDRLRNRRTVGQRIRFIV